MYNELWARCTREPIEQDRYSLSPPCTQRRAEATRAWHRSLTRFPLAQYRETFVQLASYISHPKAGISPLLPGQLILNNVSLSFKLITTVPAFIGLLWGPNEMGQEWVVCPLYHMLDFTSFTPLLDGNFFQWGLFKWVAPIQLCTSTNSQFPLTSLLFLIFISSPSNMSAPPTTKTKAPKSHVSFVSFVTVSNILK